MTARVINITVDCDDVLKVANFWSEVLGRPVDQVSSPVFASIGVVIPNERSPRGTSRRFRNLNRRRIACTWTWSTRILRLSSDL